MLFIANEVSDNKLAEYIKDQNKNAHSISNDLFKNLLKGFQIHMQQHGSEITTQKQLLKECKSLECGTYQVEEVENFDVFIKVAISGTTIIIIEKEDENQCIHLIFEGKQVEYPAYLKGYGFEEEIILLDKFWYECLNPWENPSDYPKHKGSSGYKNKVGSIKAEIKRLQEELAIIEGQQ